MKKDIDAIIELILDDADDKEDSAKYAGAMSDYGAKQLREQVEFYNYGRKGIVPTEWKKYEMRLDVEYQEYLRLKKKFENQ